MSSKQPVLLLVLIETDTLRWFVAGIDLEGGSHPLIVSEPGNLQPYLGVPVDEQVSFLRHRLAGALQRGCDRLWGRQMKPCQIVLLTDGPYRDADPELARLVGQHFCDWMTNPPVVCGMSRGLFEGSAPLEWELLAGSLEPERLKALASGVDHLRETLRSDEAWELIPNKPHAAAKTSVAADA